MWCNDKQIYFICTVVLPIFSLIRTHEKEYMHKVLYAQIEIYMYTYILEKKYVFLRILIITNPNPIQSNNWSNVTRGCRSVLSFFHLLRSIYNIAQFS